MQFPSTNRRRTIVATLLKVEASVVFALGTFLLIKGLTSKVEAVSALIGVIAFALLGGVGLLGAARGFSTGKNYGRAPAVLANLIALGVAYFQAGAHFWAMALPLALIALVTLILSISILPN
ncbi:MAG: hypothetical protein WCK79_03540 [Actinomycetes bacterium]